MRDYGKVSGRFWTGETGRKLRELGPTAQVVALYLMTAPSSNMIGLYYLPLPTLVHEVGCSLRGALEALRSLEMIGFARYDEVSETVWVVRMAAHQIGEQLSAGDKQCKGVQRQLAEYRKCKLYKEFHTLYKTAFHLDDALEHALEPDLLASPFEGPSEPLRSQEQEQEQEQEKDKAPDGACPVFLSAWNAECGNLPKVLKLGKVRERRLKARIGEGLTLQGWRNVIARCAVTPFLTGRNDRGWRVSFDWLIENDTNISKILEGRYDSAPKPVALPTPVTRMPDPRELYNSPEYRDRKAVNQ